MDVWYQQREAFGLPFAFPELEMTVRLHVTGWVGRCAHLRPDGAEEPVRMAHPTVRQGGNLPGRLCRLIANRRKAIAALPLFLVLNAIKVLILLR
jgi:hypothetical protein